ncbi:uncharacterized protein LOC132609754 [Lycium barbarum]|uniref:uncharacterized protein LOC132609754 n=1 Tax=Lycium barbarum TaxID=112863 RepID=UPI00293E9A0A|nr:uncharacterized protein LOC132609754 [Lycium barbarum]
MLRRNRYKKDKSGVLIGKVDTYDKKDDELIMETSNAFEVLNDIEENKQDAMAGNTSNQVDKQMKEIEETSKNWQNWTPNPNGKQQQQGERSNQQSVPVLTSNKFATLDDSNEQQLEGELCKSQAVEQREKSNQHILPVTPNKDIAMKEVPAQKDKQDEPHNADNFQNEGHQKEVNEESFNNTHKSDAKKDGNEADAQISEETQHSSNTENIVKHTPERASPPSYSFDSHAVIYQSNVNTKQARKEHMHKTGNNEGDKMEDQEIGKTNREMVK